MPVTGSFGGIALDVCNNIGSFQTGFAPWQVNIGLALLISTIFIALTYMFANLFRNPQIIAWAKFELFQALVTALIAVGVVAFIGASCAFPPTIFSSTGAAAGAPNMYVAAQNYLSWLRVTTVASFGATFLVNSVIVRATGITWNMRPTGVGFSTQPFAGLMPISGSVNIMINGVMLAFMITVAQKAILDYINIATLNFILPVGIFFRAFAPTRQFGGAMIGLALGLFIFYPLMLVFNDYAIRDAMNQTRADTVDKIVGNYQSGYPTNQASAETARSDATGNLLSQATPDSSGNIQAAQNVSTMVYGIVRIAFNVFIASVVLVAINFAVLITVVKELSKLFGEEVDVASLTRMI